MFYSKDNVGDIELLNVYDLPVLYYEVFIKDSNVFYKFRLYIEAVVFLCILGLIAVQQVSITFKRVMFPSANKKFESAVDVISTCLECT